MDDKQIVDGGPAFPQLDYVNEGKGPVSVTSPTQPGMSLRDYFAAKALSGMLASEANSLLAQARRRAAHDRMVNYGDLIALESYQIADAMLKARVVE